MSNLHPTIMCQIIKEHKLAIDVYVVCYLWTRVRVMYARPFNECPIPHDTFFHDPFLEVGLRLTHASRSHKVKNY